jgi:cytidine deaminase
MILDENYVYYLIEECIKIRNNAYAVYSNFKVGALIVDDNNNLVPGVNVENASYGLSICAERNAIFSAITLGAKKIKILCVVGDSLSPISPCGACRQVISEFCDEDTVIILSNLEKKYKIFKVDELLPYSFKL